MLWNSSGASTSCAPRFATSRTKPSIFAIFAAMSGPKEDWIAAGFDTEGTNANRPRIKQYVKTDVQTCLLRDRMQDIQNRRGSSDICVVLNDRNIVMGIIQGEAWNANPLSRAAEAMNPGPRTFRPDADPKEITKELRKEELDNALVTTSDGELLGILRLTQKKSQKPTKTEAA